MSKILPFIQKTCLALDEAMQPLHFAVLKYALGDLASITIRTRKGSMVPRTFAGLKIGGVEVNFVEGDK